MRYIGRRKITATVFACAVVAFGVIAHTSEQKGLSEKEAQRLLRRVAGTNFPSDAVRVKSVSGLGSSAVVIAEIETAFRFTKGEKGKWRLSEVRVDDRKWEDIELIGRAINQEKSARARAEMETLSTALEAFRRERGHYVTGKEIGVLTDHLNPRYLENMVRFDPWHRPYAYEGQAATYVLWSSGADGVTGTADDLIKGQAALMGASPKKRD